MDGVLDFLGLYAFQDFRALFAVLFLHFINNALPPPVGILLCCFDGQVQYYGYLLQFVFEVWYQYYLPGHIIWCPQHQKLQDDNKKETVISCWKTALIYANTRQLKITQSLPPGTAAI